jgi:acyl carrier protein
MEELVSKLAEILEVDDLDVSKKFSDYEEWDSLSGLTVLALLDSDYNTTMSSKEIAAFQSIEAFCKEVLSRQ